MDMDKIFPIETLSHEEAAIRYARGKFITVDGRKIHYFVKGAGRPVVLIHGFLYHSVMWRRNIPELAERFQVFALDLPGFGYSERIKFKGPMDFTRFAKMVLAIIDALDIRRCSLVAHSMGGGIAVAMAAANPQRFESMVLSSPHIMPYDFKVNRSMSNFHLPEDFLSNPAAPIIKKTLASGMFPRQDLVSEEYAAAVFRPLCIAGSNNMVMFGVKSGIDPPFLEKEAKVLAVHGIPVLLIHGGKDKIIPRETSEAFTNLSGNFHLQVFDNSGHTPHVECPDVFNRLALSFLKT